MIPVAHSAASRMASSAVLRAIRWVGFEGGPSVTTWIMPALNRRSWAALKPAALYLKIRSAEFEIECNHAAAELASQEDAAAEIAWRAAIQTMDPEDIIAGIGRDSCCGRCTPGSPGGCVITASAPYAGGACGHPIREKHLFHLNDQGRRLFRYRDNPQASIIFDTACKRLGVSKEYA